ASLEIGPESSNGQPFVAWGAADTAYVTRGVQGGSMVGVTLRLGGAAVPECLAQTTRLSFLDERLERDVPVHTYDGGGGARVTRTAWFIFDQRAPRVGETIEVAAEAGGLTASSVLTIVEERHELVALSPLSEAPRVGDTVEMLL